MSRFDAWMIRLRGSREFLGATLVVAACTTLSGMEVTGFSEARHSRFLGGYDSNPVVAPVPNASPEFLGSLYPLAGIPWNAGNRQQSYVFLSRRHFLSTQHLGAGPNLQYFSPITGLGSATHSGLRSIPDSDIAVGRLNQLIPAADAIPTYPVLDLPTTNAFTGRELLMYGWWARLGKSKISAVLPGGRTVNGQLKKYLFEHEPPNSRQDYITLQGMDSGSPSFLPVRGELTLAGNHFYVVSDSATGQYAGGGDNFLGLPEVIQQVNAVLSEDGFALSFLTEPRRAWDASSGTWSSLNNWSPTGIPGATESLGFDNAAALRTVNLTADRTARGLYFTGAVGGGGHVFSAGHTLSLGYVGIRNEATATQIFRCNIRLNASQHWTGAVGDIHVEGEVDLGSFALNTSGAGNVHFLGGLSGSGSLAIQQGKTIIASAATHSGKTYLYGGLMELTPNGSFVPAAPLVFGGGTLRLRRNLSIGSAEVLDASRVVFTTEPSSLSLDMASWSPGGSLKIEGFDSEIHTIRIGADFSAITPQQRASITVNGAPVIHRGGGSLGIATPIERWTLAQFPETAGNPEGESTVWGPLASPAGDGMSNLLKFALGRNVTNRDPAPQPTLDAEGRLMIDIARNPEAAGLLWIVEVSSDLITWSSTPQDVEVISDLPERLIARDRTPASKEGARFLRFRVSINGSSSQ